MLQTTLQPLNNTNDSLPRAIKTSTSIQEWCGHAFEQWNQNADGWDQQIFSYFQSTGDREQQFTTVWLEDELWTRIRIDPQQLPTGKFDIVASSLYRRFSHQAATPLPAVARWTAVDGADELIYVLYYPTIDRTLQIRIANTFPYHVKGWMDQVGEQTTTTTHRATIYSPYWQFNRPDDRQLRIQLGLSEK